MIIRSLSLKNFMNIETADLDFQTGVNVLAGRFGQGKSAILEAIAFCMLKDHRRGGEGTWENFLKRGTTEGFVKLVVQMSENPDDLLIFDFGMKAGADVDKKVSYAGTDHTGNSVVNLFLAKILDQEMLKNITFLMQDGDSINKMTSAQRRVIFTKIFNSDFPLVIQAIEKDMDLYKTNETDKKIQIEALKIKEYKPQRLIEVDPEELEALRTELKLAQGYDLLKSQYDTFLLKQKQYNDGKTSYASMVSEQKDHVTNIANLQDQITEKNKLLNPILEEKKRLSELVEGHYVITGTMLATELEFAQKAKETLETTSPVPTLNADIQTLTQAIAEATARGTVLRMHKEAHEKGECIQCGQKTDVGKVPEIEGEMNNLRALIAEKKLGISELNDKIDAHRNSVTLAIAKITEAQRKVAENTALKTQAKTQLESKDKEVKAINDSITDLRDVRIPTEQRYILSLDDKMNALMNGAISQSAYDWLEANKLEAPVPTERTSTQIQTELDDLLGLVAGNAEKIRLNNELIEEKARDTVTLDGYTKELNTIQLKLKRLKVVKKNWETEFPNFINLTGCNILQDQMNKFFEKNREGFVVKMSLSKKGIDFTYKVGDKDLWGPAIMTSGFESAMLTLSFKVAVAKAFGSTMVFLDEPDAAAGGDDSIRVFDTILNLGSFEQQFVISHKPEAIRFLKENGALVYYVKEGVFSQYE